jgi:hypothetical protein
VLRNHDDRRFGQLSSQLGAEYDTLGAGNRFGSASEGEKSYFAPPGVDLCRCRSNLARAQFRATASVMGTTIRHAHLPERRACSCKGPKKPHRNLVGLRRTASRSPRSVLSARAPPRSLITAIGRMQERLHGLNKSPAGAARPGAAMSGTVRRVVPFSSEADRSNGGTLASPLSRPSVCLALAGRNLPPLCSPPGRRAALSAMAPDERAYANCSRTVYSPLEHMGCVRRS